MKRTNDRPIKAALDELLKTYHLDEKVKRVRLVQSWGKIMGSAVANRTTEIRIDGRKLIVVLNSASLRQELFQAREKILKTLNDEAGEEIIGEVEFR